MKAMWSRVAAAAAIALVGVLVAPVGISAAEPLPNSMDALGDSLTLGSASGSSNASYSTGTEPAVNSLYQRILAKNPAIASKNYTDAVGGSRVSTLNGQMTSAVGRGVDLVTVLIGGGDVCAGSEAEMTPVSAYRAQFEQAMATFASGLPNARVFVLSLPNIYQLWELLKDNPQAREKWVANHMCQAMLANPLSTDQADIDRRARVLQRVIDFNTQLAQVCAQYGQCRFDNNAVFNLDAVGSDVSTVDYYHPSVLWQTKVAQLLAPQLGLSPTIGSETLLAVEGAAPGDVAAAFDGTNYLVVWSDSTDLYGVRTDATGAPLGSVYHSTAPGTQYHPDVAFDSRSASFLVTWTDTRGGNEDVYGIRVAIDGSFIGNEIPIDVTPAESQRESSVISGGRQWLVAYASNCCSGSSNINARLVSAGGTLSPVINVSRANGVQGSPSAGWNRKAFFVAWDDTRSGAASDIYGARVSARGSVLDPGGKVVSTAGGSQRRPSVASRRDRYFVVWSDNRSGADFDIYGAQVSANGDVSPTSGVPISTAPGNQTEPDLALGSRLLAVWQDERASAFHPTAEVYGARVDVSGVVEDPTGFRIGSTNASAGAVVANDAGSWRAFYAESSNQMVTRSVTPK
jgi:lysophospholipase L1-like esterase